MKILTKFSLLLLLLFLSGCAHHSGYYSGRSNAASYGVSVDAYLPYSSYSTYYDRDVYIQRPIKRKYRVYQQPRYDRHYYGKQHKYQQHYDKRARAGKYIDKHRSKPGHNQRDKRFGGDRGYQQQGKQDRRAGGRRQGADYYSYR